MTDKPPSTGAISIIIPARNGASMTSTCLQTALYTLQVLHLAAQLILIDDASDEDEGIWELFRDTKRSTNGHEVTIVRARTRIHYTSAFALGLHLAKHENVFFLSNDMAVAPHFLMALLGVAALNPQFGIVRGTSNWVDSHGDKYRIEPPQPVVNYVDVRTFSASQFQKIGLDFAEDQMLSGDAVLVKRSVIDRIGVLDSRFFGYFGDIDFGMRAHLAGFRLVCARGAWLHHIGAGHLKFDRENKTPEERNTARMALVQKAYEEFRQKWDMSLPERASEVHFSNYNAISERAGIGSGLKCTVPPSLLDQIIIE